MTIPVTNVVNVSIAIGAQFPARRGFGILNIVTNEADGPISRSERIRSYSNVEGVTAEWDANSEVVKAATSYFSQQPKPTQLKVSTRYDAAQAAQLRGGAVTDVSVFDTDEGSFRITIDGVEHSVTGMDFSEANITLDEVAVEVQKAIRATGLDFGFLNAICEHDGTRFTITSGTTGNDSNISFLTPGEHTDISSLLQMQAGEATKVNGIFAETVSQSLSVIDDIDPDWYGLMFTKEVRDGILVNGEKAVEAAADWVEARIKVFGNTCNDFDVTDSVTTTDIASVLSNKSLRRTMTTYSSFPNEYPSASILGRAFTVNFNQPNSTLTLKFKQLPGTTVEALTQTQKAVIDRKNANSLIRVGDSTMYAESFMASGIFFDEVHGIDWLQNAVETNVFGLLLSSATKIPYTTKGAAALEQQVINALDEGVRNGLLAPGVTIEGEFLARGYRTTVVPVADINQSDQEARSYPGLSFVALGAGAIHSAQINGTFER